MLTVLGKTPAAGDAVDLLLECHDRIRSFLALARRVADPKPIESLIRHAAAPEMPAVAYGSNHW